MSSARPHDSQHFGDVMMGNETEVWADSAYRSGAREKQLEEAEVKSQINEKAKRNQPLTEPQKTSHKEKSKVRSRVEHCYAQIKTPDGFSRTRYYGMKANRCDAFLHAIAYNFRRGVFLLKQQVRQVLNDMKKQADFRNSGRITSKSGEKTNQSLNLAPIPAQSIKNKTSLA